MRERRQALHLATLAELGPRDAAVPAAAGLAQHPLEAERDQRPAVVVRPGAPGPSRDRDASSALTTPPSRCVSAADSNRPGSRRAAPPSPRPARARGPSKDPPRLSNTAGGLAGPRLPARRHNRSRHKLGSPPPRGWNSARGGGRRGQGGARRFHGFAGGVRCAHQRISCYPNGHVVEFRDAVHAPGFLRVFVGPLLAGRRRPDSFSHSFLRARRFFPVIASLSSIDRPVDRTSPRRNPRSRRAAIHSVTQDQPH